MTDKIQSIFICDISTPVKIRPVDEAHVAKLAESIKFRGLEQPIVVHERDNGYVLGPGRHRLEALIKLGETKVEAIVRGPASDEDIMAEQVAENLQRKDLTALEEADLCASLLERVPDLHHAAAIMGRSVGWMETRAALTRLSPKVRAWVEDGSLPLAHARLIARLPTAEDQERVAEGSRGVDGEPASPLWRLKESVERLGADLGRVTWELGVAFGASNRDCASCPMNGANTRGLFDDAKEAKQSCLDLACFNDKTQVAARGARKCANWIVKEGVAEKGATSVTSAVAKKARDAREVPYVTVKAIQTEAGFALLKDSNAKSAEKASKGKPSEPAKPKEPTAADLLDRAIRDWEEKVGDLLSAKADKSPQLGAFVILLANTDGCEWGAKGKKVEIAKGLAKRAAKLDGAAFAEVAKHFTGYADVSDLPSEVLVALADAVGVKAPPKPTLEGIKAELAKKPVAKKAA